MTTQAVDFNTKNKTKVHEMLSEAGISMHGVSRMLDMYPYHVREILDPTKFTQQKLCRIIKVRSRVEALLKAAGFEFDKDSLWSEYKMTDEAA